MTFAHRYAPLLLHVLMGGSVAQMACTDTSTCSAATDVLQMHGNSLIQQRQQRSTSYVGGDMCNEDSWPDKDHGLVCGECKVLVNKFDTKYQTCAGYCANVGLDCVGAWEEEGDTCTVKHDLRCDETLASSDAICECGEGQVSQRPADQASSSGCDEDNWPDKDHGLVCGDCKVLVNRFDSKYQTCAGYCGAVGLSCVGAWEEEDDTCTVKHGLRCDETLASSDAICECGKPDDSQPEPEPESEAESEPEPEPQTDAPPLEPTRPSGTCDEDSWPDKDHGLICGECKVLVDKFDSKYKTCDGYCDSLGLQCEGAWDEVEDTCDAKNVVQCDSVLPTSDAICQCGGSTDSDAPSPHAPSPDVSCTEGGVDPWSTGQELTCCSGLQRCIGDWLGDGNWHFLCLASCDETPASKPQVEVPLCGIAPNKGACSQELAYLARLNPRAADMSCMGYGGSSDPCTLSITNDAGYGMDKDPSACKQDVFFLWDEPDTQCERGYGSCGRKWAQSKWRAYVRKWGSQIQQARARGVRFTTPLMKSADEASLLRRFSNFFDGCSECNDPASKYYVDVLAWNAFCLQKPPSPYDVNGQFTYLKSLAAALKRNYPGRPVYATNFGLLYARSAADQASAIAEYGIFDRTKSQIDGVFYFAGQDYCGKPASECTTKNFLQDVVEYGRHKGKTLGQVLVDACYP